MLIINIKKNCKSLTQKKLLKEAQKFMYSEMQKLLLNLTEQHQIFASLLEQATPPVIQNDERVSVNEI